MKFTSFAYQTGIALYSKLPFKKQLCQAIRMIPISKEKYYRDLKFKGTFSVKLGDRKLKLLHSGQTIENELFWKGIDGGWEKISINIWMQLCKESHFIADIGANTGIYALVAAATNPQATVFAFEPSLKTFEKLNQHIELNKFSNIIAQPVAVSNRNGEAILFDLDSDHQYSASLNKDMPVGEIPKMEVNVPITRLDTFFKCQHIEKIDLLKIDVEMHEPEVLEGFYYYLQAFLPTMIIEILTDEMGARIEKQLLGLDYSFFDIDEINLPKRTSHLTKSSCYNFLICREAVAKQLHLI
jgi:FkbM family methyltransferase